MSRKNTTKRLAQDLVRNGVPPTQPGLLSMIRGLRLRPRSVRRAVMREEQRRLPADVPHVWSERWRAPKASRYTVLSRNEYRSHMAQLDRAAAARAKLKPLPATRRAKMHRVTP